MSKKTMKKPSVREIQTFEDGTSLQIDRSYMRKCTTKREEAEALVKSLNEEAEVKGKTSRYKLFVHTLGSEIKSVRGDIRAHISYLPGSERVMYCVAANNHEADWLVNCYLGIQCRVRNKPADVAVAEADITSMSRDDQMRILEAIQQSLGIK